MLPDCEQSKQQQISETVVNLRVLVLFIKDVSARGGGRWLLQWRHRGEGVKVNYNRTSPKHKISLIKTYFFCRPHAIYF